MEKEKQSSRHKDHKKVIGFKVIEDECIWMKAGVVNFRNCDNAYDCHNCPFDKGMKKAMGLKTAFSGDEKQPAWVAYLKKNFFGASRPCRHSLTGKINAPKICTMNYECHHCSYDQMLDELDLTQPVDAPVYKNVSGYKMAVGYYYHMGHSWARFEHGGRVRVGVDDFLVKLFGTIKNLELPPLGAEIKQEQVGWTFSRNGHKAAVLSPVTGTVLAVNHKVLNHPDYTNLDPYQGGWLFILEPDLPKRNLKRLFFEEEGYRWMEQETNKLMGLMGKEYERLAATGGKVINDLYGNFPELGWDRLVKTFLHTETR